MRWMKTCERNVSLFGGSDLKRGRVAGKIGKPGWWLAASFVFATFLCPGLSRAFSFADGMINVHGYGEVQLRGLSNNFSESLDLAQWYNVLNVEIEADLLPNGLGPISKASAFVRLEGRYDCVYSHGCGTLSSADVYGDRGKALPKHRSNGRRSGWAGGTYNGDTRDYHGVHPLDSAANPYLRNSRSKTAPFNPVTYEPGRSGSSRRANLWQVPGMDIAFSGRGADGAWGSWDDPAPFVLSRYMDHEFAIMEVKGANHGTGNWIQLVSFNDLHPVGALANKPNPLMPTDYNPILYGSRGWEYNLATYPYLTRPQPVGVVPSGGGYGMLNGFGGNFAYFGPGGPDPATPPFDPLTGYPGYIHPGTGERVWYNPAGNDVIGYNFPYTPPPQYQAGSRSNCKDARGLYIPNSGLRRVCNDLGDFDQNYDATDLKWNHGASQEDEQELKEAYLDVELFDSRAWVRLGKQNIVWGKTELFRTTDQFNPQDYGLSALASLEESRIALWAGRFVYSFFDVGPLEDVRFEAAINFDEFEPVDIGRCGEAFVVNMACLKATGLWAHGFSGLGLAGEIRPDDPWESTKGIEGGARVEFRYGRFSFALMDFYGFDDIPHVEHIFTYERNVDPYTGRPRAGNNHKPCDPDGVRPGALGPDTRGCLEPTKWSSDGMGGYVENNRDALRNHHANQQLFAFSCAVNIGNATIGQTPGGTPITLKTMENLAQSCGLRTNNSGAWVQVGLAANVPNAFSVLLGGGPSNQQAVVHLGNLGAISTPAHADFRAQLSGRYRMFGAAYTNGTPWIPLNSNEGGTGVKGAPGLSPGTIVNGGTTGRVGIDTSQAQDLVDTLSPEQQALLGCGKLWSDPDQLALTGFGGADCTRNGFDFMNAHAPSLTQSWFINYDLPRNANRRTDMGFQPGTTGFYDQYPQYSGNGCMAYDSQRGLVEQAGCRRMFRTSSDAVHWDTVLDTAITTAGFNPASDNPSLDIVNTATAQFRTDMQAKYGDYEWDPAVDGAPIVAFGAESQTTIGNRMITAGATNDPGGRGGLIFGRCMNPIFIEDDRSGSNCYVSEMAVLSANLLYSIAMSSPDFPGQWRNEDGTLYFATTGNFDAMDPNSCGFVRPDLCKAVQDFMQTTAVKKKSRRIGSNGMRGRRDFAWHTGSPVVLEYEKRNVLGFSMDFAEDTTKSNWSVELTWMNDVPHMDNAEWDGLTRADLYNLTVSVDRPTFINFLNANRTFFFNSQWFFQYIEGYRESFTTNGPLNVLATFTLQTGYFQDRLTPTITFVYDFNSGSGGFLPGFLYRFNDSFSAEFGVNYFFDKWDEKEMPLTVLEPEANRGGRYRNSIFVQNGLSPVGDKDEVYLRIRYTF